MDKMKLVHLQLWDFSWHLISKNAQYIFQKINMDVIQNKINGIGSFYLHAHT